MTQLATSDIREATRELSVNLPVNLGEVEEENGNLFLGKIGTETNNIIWSVDLLMVNSQVRFKIDTGTDVTVIPDKIYEVV